MIAITDLHIFDYPEHRQHDRIGLCLNALKDCFTYNAKTGGKYILFAGDINQKEKITQTVVLDRLNDFLDKMFAKYPDQRILAISGNHDISGRAVFGKPYPPTIIKQIKHPNWRCIDGMSVAAGAGLIDVIGLPYYKTPDDFSNELDRIIGELNHLPKKRFRILLIHNTPKHLANPNIPFDFDPFDPRFDNFDLVICGHIHKFQKYSDKFYLLGSPLHRDMGDLNDEKFLLHIDENTKEVTPISRKGRYPELKHIEHPTEEDYQKYFVIPVYSIKQSRENIKQVSKVDMSKTPSDIFEEYSILKNQHDKFPFLKSIL